MSLSASSKALHLLPVIMFAIKKKQYAKIIVTDARILKLHVFEAENGLKKIQNHSHYVWHSYSEIDRNFYLSFFLPLSNPA